MSRHRSLLAAAVLGLVGGSYTSASPRGFTYQRRPDPAYSRQLPHGWQRAPGRGKRRTAKRKYIRRASGYRRRA